MTVFRRGYTAAEHVIGAGAIYKGNGYTAHSPPETGG
jgi:hypothetical protein